MDGIHFADGLDTPDRLAFGLGAPQLITVVTGCLLAFGLLHAPLPAAAAVPLAVVIVAVAAALGWFRVCGRPALDWAVFATRHLLGPRRGVLVLVREPQRRVPRPGSRRRSRTKAHTGRGTVTAAAGVTAAAAAPNIIRLPGLTRAPDVADEAPVPRRGARRIVFYSLKGGTGRTTLSTEIAT